jgi:hypothetical protein
MRPPISTTCVPGHLDERPTRHGGGPRRSRRTNGHDEVMARAANLLIGWAAYETARRLYPNERVDYHDGARIIERSEPPQK